MRKAIPFVAIVCMTGAVGAARAQPAPPADKLKAKTAKQYVDAGLAAQANGDYDTAITFYEKAYELVPHPLLVFNMAQAHRLAGRAMKAVELYRKYLDADPNGVQSKSAHDFITELQPLADAQKTQVEADKAGAEARRAEEDKRQREAAAAASAANQPPPGPAPREVEVDTGRTLRFVGLGAGGVGVVALGVGIAFGIHARSLADELSQAGAMYDPKKVDRGHTANSIAITGIAAGSALVVAGALIYWRGLANRHTKEQISFAPVVGTDRIGLGVAGVWP